MNMAIVIGIIVLMLVSGVSAVFIALNHSPDPFVIEKRDQEPEKIGTVKIEAGKTATLN